MERQFSRCRGQDNHNGGFPSIPSTTTSILQPDCYLHDAAELQRIPSSLLEETHNSHGES